MMALTISGAYILYKNMNIEFVPVVLRFISSKFKTNCQSTSLCVSTFLIRISTPRIINLALSSNFIVWPSFQMHVSVLTWVQVTHSNVGELDFANRRCYSSRLLDSELSSTHLPLNNVWSVSIVVEYVEQRRCLITEIYSCPVFLRCIQL